MVGQAHSHNAPEPRGHHSGPGPDSGPKPEVYRFKFHGTTTQFLGIVFKNALLTFVTFGFYTFVAKVNLRKFMHHSSEFHGERFTYHGTWQELLNGYLKIILFVIAYFVLSRAKVFLPDVLLLLTHLIESGLLILAIGFATYAGRRYLMSRTSWRGIFFAMQPSSEKFVKLFFKGTLFSTLTLGLYTPYFQNQKHAFLMKSTAFGNMKFAYTGLDKDAARIFFDCFPLMIITLGLYYPWYRARISRFRAKHTWIGSETLGAARGHLNVSGSDLFKLYAFNAFILIVTCGLGVFWLVSYNMSYYLDRFSLVGHLNFAATAQIQSKGSTAGASLASLAGLDVGM